MLVVTFALFVWPAIAIAGIVTLIKEIKRKVKGDKYDIPQTNIHYETQKEEEYRINYYGRCDDETWGKL